MGPGLISTRGFAVFELAKGAYEYRPLRADDRGWDVYALQSALGRPRDGIFGPATLDAVKGYQERSGLVADGIAGTVTQRSLALYRLFPVQRTHEIPPGLMRGQTEKESSFQLGSHTAPYSDGERDCGVVQRNTNYATREQAFNVPDSLALLGRQLRTKHDQYEGWGVVRDQRRLWGLAAGSWNAPAWTDRLARGQTLTQSQSDHIEAYISRVFIYCKIT